MYRWIFIVLVSLSTTVLANKPQADQTHQVSDTHKYEVLVGGPRTRMINAEDQIHWTNPQYLRYCYRTNKGDSGGADRFFFAYQKHFELWDADFEKVTFRYKVQSPNKEIASAVITDDGHFLVAENGTKPRLRELDATGKILNEIAIQPDTKKIHMQTRVARKLDNGHYLVAHRFSHQVKEYDRQGKVVRTIRTDIKQLGDKASKSHPFDVHRLANGNTLVSCTTGDVVVEFDKNDQVAWMLTNEDLGMPFLRDVCALKVLDNGNLIIGCYAQRNPKLPIMIEVTRDKKVVWQLFDKDPKKAYIHYFDVWGKVDVPPAKK